MEKNWERTLPFLYVDRETINKLFKGIIKKDEIISVKPVDEGCRTSNYVKYFFQMISNIEKNVKF